MRSQLEYIQLIDKYLRNILYDKDLILFENRLKTDIKLKEEVGKQKILMEAINRDALKVSAQKAHRTYKTVKLLKVITVVVVIISVAAMAYFSFGKKTEAVEVSSKMTNFTETLPPVDFQINSRQDTALETENGLNLAIPTNTFETQNGRFIGRNADSIIAESLVDLDTLKTGISTTSNEEALGKKPKVSGMDSFTETLPQADFQINTAKDTVIETENGLVLAIPAYAFVTEEGRAVSGNITFKVAEAFNDFDILRAGLSTTSNGEMLETGGMFFLSANQNGEELKLKEGQKILSQIPNLHPEKEMMLFDGVLDSTGNINWVDPKPFPKDLLTFDIMTLDFYPEGYLEELNNEKIYNDSILAVGVRIANHSKHFTDSLYYSYARLFEKQSGERTEQLSREQRFRDRQSRRAIRQQRAAQRKQRSKLENIFGERREDIYELYPGASPTAMTSPCPIPFEINPAKIKAIWNSEFNNTILATREFELRIKLIHKARQGKILELYAKNIDKPLWYLDSLAAKKVKREFRNQFRAFYRQKKTGVKVVSGLSQKLAEYFERKQRTFTQEASLLFEKYRAEKLRLEQEFENKKSEKAQQESQRRARVLDEEYRFNLRKAYRQLGKSRTRSSSVATSFSVGTPFVISIGLGAKNIDQLIFASTKTRKSLKYTDPNSRKKVIIEYSNISLKILNTERFDKIFAYLIPDSLSSFNRMQSADNVRFSFSLNELLNYRLVCLAYIGNTPYFTEVEKAIPLDYELTLERSSEEDIRSLLRSSSMLIQKEIESDQVFYKVEFAYEKKQEKYIRNAELNFRIGRFLFPDLDSRCFGMNNETRLWRPSSLFPE